MTLASLDLDLHPQQELKVWVVTPPPPRTRALRASPVNASETFLEAVQALCAERGVPFSCEVREGRIGNETQVRLKLGDAVEVWHGPQRFALATEYLKENL